MMHALYIPSRWVCGAVPVLGHHLIQELKTIFCQKFWGSNGKRKKYILKLATAI